jgi:hypothetical protein
MGAAGFTVNHAYNAANVEIGERPDDAQALQFINETQKNGMMALFLIPARPGVRRGLGELPPPHPHVQEPPGAARVG